MSIDIARLNLQEPTTLLSATEKRKRFLSKRRPTASVRKQAIALTARHGYTIEELFGDQPAAQPTQRKRGARCEPTNVAPKYRDPDNERNTCLGRGSMPRWLTQCGHRAESHYRTDIIND